MLPASISRAMGRAGTSLVQLWSGRPRPRGRLEGIRSGQVHGWAFCPGGERLRIRLTGDAGASLVVRADRYRADLAAIGMGDGHYGFAAPAGAFDPGGRIGAFVVPSGLELANSPLACREPSSPLVGCKGRIRFRIDQRRPADRVTGWAIDEGDPDRRVRIGLSDRGSILAEARATRCRTELDGAAHDALHGFSLPFARGAARHLDVVALDFGQTLVRLSCAR